MNTIKALIDHHANAQPDKPFLIAPESNIGFSYGELQKISRMIGKQLDRLNIAKGDKVALLLPNGYWSTALFLGITYNGRVIVPLNAVAGNSALFYVIEHSDCKLIFASDELAKNYAEVLDQAPACVQIVRTDINQGPEWEDADNSRVSGCQPRADDTAILMYTSGTTGVPKGVMLSHRNAVAGGNNTAIAHQLTADDRALCVLPLYHINAQIVTVMAPLVSGGSVVMPHRFRTGMFWQQIADHRCTWFSVVPTIIAYLIEQAEQQGFDRASLGGLDQLRFGRSASAPLSPEIHRKFEGVFGIPIIETMGLTETAAQILSNPLPPEKIKYGSPGRAVGNEAKIADEAGNECSYGVIGELMIRGDNVTREYYKNPEATSSTIESDGWLHTGDLGYQDEDGFFFITGRIKELIIKGGENIAPREIDEALYEHPSVLEAAGFGLPCDRYGQDVFACVALKEGTSCDETELKSFLENKLGKFKSPRRIFFMDELPKGPSGKIQRLRLHDYVESQGL